jgi:hypothetical protein
MDPRQKANHRTNRDNYNEDGLSHRRFARYLRIPCHPGFHWLPLEKAGFALVNLPACSSLASQRQ